MATDEDPEAPGSRLALLIGLAVAGVASTAALGRVYAGSVTLKLCLVSIVATALAALMGRRGVILATALSAAALLIAIGWLIFPDTIRYGLPTLTTMRAIGKALHTVGRDANVTPAPAGPIPSLMLAGITAVWTAAFAAHSLAFRARSPLLALTPLAALLAFAGIVLEDGARPGYVLLFMLGTLLVLLGDSVRRVGQWGPISAWHGRRRLITRSRTTARGAWRVAAGTLGIALFLPWLLPGFGGGPLLHLNEGSQRAFSLDPMDDIRPRLITNPNVVAFTVRADRATYWRTNTLDTFDGSKWSPSDTLYTNAQPVVGGSIPRPADSLLASGTDLVPVHAQLRFEGLTQPSVPIAGSPLLVSVSNGSLRYDPSTGTLVSSEYTGRGMDLSVISEVVVPTPVELKAFVNISVPGSVATALPAGQVTAEIRRLAQGWTAGSATSYEAIMRLQQHLKGWAYDLKVPPASSDDALLRFLTVTHRGYCQQFAGAMAVMLRTLGIPTRVAVGFTSGTFDPKTRTWRVTMADAHSWVEVRFPGYGWLTFDPTPTRANPAVAAYDAPSALSNDPKSYLNSGDSTNVGENQRGRPGGFDPAAGERRLGQPNGRFLNGGIGPQGQAGASANLRLLVLAVGALLLLAVVLIPILKLAGRRWARRGTRSPPDRVLAAYVAVLDTASDVGFGRRPAETLEEYRARLAQMVPFSNGDFDALTALAQRAAYAGGSAEPASDLAVTELARRASKDVRKAAGPWRSLVGAYRIGPARSPD